MIRIKLINEGRVVKQITSRVHEGVVLEQIKKYKDPFDTIQVVEGELSEGAKDMLHHVARKIIPAAMAAGVAMGGASPARAGEGGSNPNYPGLNYSVGQHIKDIVSPNYKEIMRQREHGRTTERQVWNAKQNELRKQRIAAARAEARGSNGHAKVYDQARNSGDGKFIIIYGMDDSVTRIPAKGTEFMPADSQRLAHYIAPSGRVYYVRHPHTAGIAQSISKESVTEAGTIGTVGTIPASGTTSMTQKTKFAPTGKTTDVQVNDKGELELADPNALDPQTKQKMAQVGLKVAEDADTLEGILSKYSADYAKFKAGGDVDENPDFFDALYTYYFDEMPYGVKKARDGDPYEWITQQLDQESGIDPVVEAEEDELEATPCDQAAADQNIIMQIRKAADYERPTKVNLADGTEGVIAPNIARLLLSKFEGMRPDGKALLQQTLNTQQGFAEILAYFGGGVREQASARVGNIMQSAMAEAGFGRDNRDAYQRDYDHSVAGMGKRQSYAYQQDGGANDEGWDRPESKAPEYTYYIRFKDTGKVYKQKGVPKSFANKAAANAYALAMIKNNPTLKGNVLLSVDSEDKGV